MRWQNAFEPKTDVMERIVVVCVCVCVNAHDERISFVWNGTQVEWNGMECKHSLLCVIYRTSKIAPKVIP